MFWLVVIGIFITLAIYNLLSALYGFFYRDKIAVNARLEALAEEAKVKIKVDEELEKPFFERAMRPVLDKLAGSMGKVMPAQKKDNLQKKLMSAGNPGNLTPSEFVVIRYGLVLGFPILVLFLLLPMGFDLRRLIMFMALAGAAGVILPDFYLKSLASKREEAITKALPDALDLMTVSVEAGLGFDAALVKVVEKLPGVLSNEFGRVLQEIKMGKPRREALRDLGHRANVEDLTTFLGSLIQADQLGVSIGNVLRLQSEQMRGKRRQRAEEKAMKAPIKMLIPLILFIFPTIFIVLLGPAALQIIATMGK